MKATKIQISQIVDLANNKDSKALPDYLNKHSITELYLEYRNLNDSIAKYIANVLKNNTVPLIRLDFRNNKITDAGAWYIAEALKTNSTLIGLNLNSNKITDIGAGYLAQALTINPMLEQLHLQSNQVSIEGENAFMRSMRSIKHSPILFFRFYCDTTSAVHFQDYLLTHKEARLQIQNSMGFQARGVGSALQRYLDRDSATIVMGYLETFISADNIRDITLKHNEQGSISKKNFLIGYNKPEETQQEITQYFTELRSNNSPEPTPAPSLLWGYSKYAIGAAVIAAGAVLSSEGMRLYNSRM